MKNLSDAETTRIYSWLKQQLATETTLSELEKNLYMLGIKEDILSGFKKHAAEKSKIIVEKTEYKTERTGLYRGVIKKTPYRIKGPKYPSLAKWDEFFKKQKNKLPPKEGLHHKIAKELHIPLDDLFYSALIERLNNYLTNPCARSSELEKDLSNIELILNDLSEKDKLYAHAKQTISKSYDRLKHLRWQEDFNKAFPIL